MIVKTRSFRNDLTIIMSLAGRDKARDKTEVRRRGEKWWGGAAAISRDGAVRARPRRVGHKWCVSRDGGEKRNFRAHARSS